MLSKYKYHVLNISKSESVKIKKVSVIQRFPKYSEVFSRRQVTPCVSRDLITYMLDMCRNLFFLSKPSVVIPNQYECRITPTHREINQWLYSTLTPSQWSGSITCRKMFNPSRPGDVYMRQRTRPSFGQIVACHLSGAGILLLANKRQWNLNRNLCFFIRENAFEYVVSQLAAILSRSQFMGLNRMCTNVAVFTVITFIGRQ